MMQEQSIYKEIISEISDFIEKNGRKPFRIFLTQEDEQRFEKLKLSDLFEPLYSEITVHGARKALTEIDGIPITWGADNREYE